MANLELIKNLNQKYGKSSPFTISTKSFSLRESFETRHIDYSIQDNIDSLGANYAEYFNEGKEAEVVLLFVDICDFSSRHSSLDGKEISTYFDEYYDLVIPIIYEYNGEIDKIIGDGIVCIFGQPFIDTNLSDCISKADKCAKKLIVETKKKGKFASKIAFHSGKINYFKNKSGFYNELTVVGKPLTELFRLESISEDEKINYFVNYRSFSEENWNKDINQNTMLWTLENIKEVPNELMGVDYKYIQTNRYLL